jgi:hypothetical protein
MDGSRITAPHAGARAKAERRLPVSVTLLGAASFYNNVKSSSDGGTLATRRPSRGTERAWRSRS